MRSSAAFEGSLREVGLAKAEAPWDFGLLSSLPGELGRSRYQGLRPSLTAGWGRSSQAPLGFVTGFSLLSSPVLSSAIRRRNNGVYSCSCSGCCGFAKAARKAGREAVTAICVSPLWTTMCPSHCFPGDQHNHFVDSFSFVFFNLRCELSFFPPWAMFS